ncbi:MvaI/BcnI family restriction endonuclease [Galliscardovia ingluviei]|nr:MvaI/BcnI family restriction endonuclease [Galliscardovia ingluviei]
MSDTPVENFATIFAKLNTPVAFLVPTPTGYKKSIMDAVAPVRDLLSESKVHDFQTQSQGPENKHVVPAFFVHSDRVVETQASLYRPITKSGDPRIWFYDLKKYCQPCNLLALTVIDGAIYVFNLSDTFVADSLVKHDYAYNILSSGDNSSLIEQQLLELIRQINAAGPQRSITPGDPGVGDTLEHALGIQRNNSKNPDYMGIELKTTRLTRNGKLRTPTRSTLFSQVPDAGMPYREIVEKYGKMQVPRGSSDARLQLYETFRVSRPNAYGLVLEVNENDDRLDMKYQDGDKRSYVASWTMKLLKERLRTKHPETFWVGATSEMIDGVEYFRYVRVMHTKNPNASLLAPLIEADKVTLDLAAHFNVDGKWRDHGVLFKMNKNDFPLLFSEPEEFIF